jgi:hypothetical protein
LIAFRTRTSLVGGSVVLKKRKMRRLIAISSMRALPDRFTRSTSEGGSSETMSASPVSSWARRLDASGTALTTISGMVALVPQ